MFFCIKQLGLFRRSLVRGPSGSHFGCWHLKHGRTAASARLRYLGFLLLPFSVFAGIDLSLSSKSCLPGDMIELRAESSFDELTHFELSFPSLDSVHVVAHQRQPLRYEQGMYRQQDVWLFQPVAPGEIGFEGLKALLQQGIEESEWTFEALPVLTVLPYPESNDGAAAEQLPGASVVTVPATNWLIWLLGIVLSVSVIVSVGLLLRKKPVVEAAEAGVNLKTLLLELEAEAVPLDLCEVLLADESLQMSDRLRLELERLVYAKSSDVEALRALLKEEVAS